MKKRLILLIIIPILLILSGCRETVRNEIFENAKLKYSSNDTIIDLNDVIKFKWDSLYVFDPSTSPAVFKRYFHDNYWQDLTFQLIFTYQGKIVHREIEFYNSDEPLNADFQFNNDSTNYLIINKNSSKFKIEKEPTTREIYVLYPVRRAPVQ
jgi:protein involved in sex pheromone biosynthesis